MESALMICCNLKRRFLDSQNEQIAPLIHAVCNRVDQTINLSFSSVDWVHDAWVNFPIALFVRYGIAGGDRG